MRGFGAIYIILLAVAALGQMVLEVVGPLWFDATEAIAEWRKRP